MISHVHGESAAVYLAMREGDEAAGGHSMSAAGLELLVMDDLCAAWGRSTSSWEEIWVSRMLAGLVHGKKLPCSIGENRSLKPGAGSREKKSLAREEQAMQLGSGLMAGA